MHCEELFVALTEYVDGNLDNQTATRIQRHLEECPVCELMVDNIRKTISVYCTNPTVEMPPVFQEHLDGLLRDRWKAKFAANGAGETADGQG